MNLWLKHVGGLYKCVRSKLDQSCGLWVYGFHKLHVSRCGGPIAKSEQYRGGEMCVGEEGRGSPQSGGKWISNPSIHVLLSTWRESARKSDFSLNWIAVRRIVLQRIVRWNTLLASNRNRQSAGAAMFLGISRRSLWHHKWVSEAVHTERLKAFACFLSHPFGASIAFAAAAIFHPERED